MAFIFIAFLGIFLIYFVEKVVGPGLQRLHVATPVMYVPLYTYGRNVQLCSE